MATDVEIASLALTRIGHDAIASFSASGNKAQRWFFTNYDIIRLALLREHPWGFATQRRTLTEFAPPPINEYPARYELPEDFVRLIRINGANSVGYRIEGKFILCYQSAVIQIEYIFNQDEEAAFSTTFVDLLTARLSAEICFYLTDNTALTEQAWKIFNEKLAVAKATDAREQTPKGSVANLAMIRLGEPVNGSPEAQSFALEQAARTIEANYDFARKALLREHAWRFATKRAILTADPIRPITGATKANPVVITSAAHGFVNGATVYIDSIVGMSQINGKTFTVAGATANTFQLSGINGTGYTAYASGGFAYGYIAKEYRYRFALPADCLRLLRINATEADEYRVEQGYIYTDEGEVDLEYICDVTSENDFDPQFTDVFAQRLAAEAAFAYTRNAGTAQAIKRDYEDKLRMARTMDSRQGTPRGLDADTWLNARA